MRLFQLMILSSFLLNLFCSKPNQPEISVERYAAFRSECLLLCEAYPQDTASRKKILASIMNNFSIDSTQLEEFYTYYKKNPDKWLEIEIAIEKKLGELKKGRETHGRS